MKNKSKFNQLFVTGKTVCVDIESLAAGGYGVAHENETKMPIFANFVAPGDQAELKLYDIRKNFAFASLVNLLKQSDKRTEPLCKLFTICGGCQWQHINYQAQLDAKQDIIRQALKHIGGLDTVLVKATLASPNEYYYRNKVQFPTANPTDSSRVLAGYYKQDSHELVNIKHCPVQPEPFDRMLETTKELCERYGLSAYNEKKRTGLLRHITARYSFDNKQMLVMLVLNAQANQIDMTLMEELANELMKGVPEIVGVCLNFNAYAGNKIMTDDFVLLAGQPYIIEVLRTNKSDLPDVYKQGIKFRLSPTSFFQINTNCAVLLLEEILQAIKKSPSDNKAPLIIDVYAGVGTIALWLAKTASSVIAIEENPQSIIDGKDNLELNHINNVEFKQGSAENILPQLVKEGIVADVLVVDPPRKGLSEMALSSILSLACKNVVYVSCNPATLARDLKIFTANGYEIKQIQPIDMFPQTHHVESITLLSRK